MGHLSKNHKKKYMELAKLVSSFSYCSRKKVGCVIVRKNRVISTGYNGTVSGFENSCEINNVTKKEVLHAEANALLSCAKLGIKTNNSIAFVTMSPCVECSKIMIQSGVKKVVYEEEYKCTEGLELLRKSKIKIEQINATKIQ